MTILRIILKTLLASKHCRNRQFVWQYSSRKTISYLRLGPVHRHVNWAHHGHWETGSASLSLSHLFRNRKVYLLCSHIIVIRHEIKFDGTRLTLSSVVVGLSVQLFQEKVSNKTEEKMQDKVKMILQKDENLVHIQQYSDSFCKNILNLHFSNRFGLYKVWFLWFWSGQNIL